MVSRLLLAAAVGLPSGVEPPLPEEVDIALRAADELETSGAFAAARAQVEAVIETGAVPADTLPGLNLMICELWSRQDEPDRARSCYVELGASSPDSEGGALGRYRAALLVVRLGAERRGLAELDALIVSAHSSTQ